MTVEYHRVINLLVCVFLRKNTTQLEILPAPGMQLCRSTPISWDIKVEIPGAPLLFSEVKSELWCAKESHTLSCFPQPPLYLFRFYLTRGTRAVWLSERVLFLICMCYTILRACVCLRQPAVTCWLSEKRLNSSLEFVRTQIAILRCTSPFYILNID